MKVFERAIRRANIPIAMSKGFNPHPKLSIPLALSLGISGRDEILELELLRPMSPETLVESLHQQLPGEIHILSAEAVSNLTKSRVHTIVYEVIFRDTNLLKTLKIHELLQQSSITINRLKNEYQKPFDIRPSIEEIRVEPDRLFLIIKTMPEGIARPEEILHALGISRENVFFEIVRTKVNLSSA